jgi:hypothetical protein
MPSERLRGVLAPAIQNLRARPSEDNTGLGFWALSVRKVGLTTGLHEDKLAAREDLLSVQQETLPIQSGSDGGQSGPDQNGPKSPILSEFD